MHARGPVALAILAEDGAHLDQQPFVGHDPGGGRTGEKDRRLAALRLQRVEGRRDGYSVHLSSLHRPLSSRPVIHDAA
jgi:hypothetical protein